MGNTPSMYDFYPGYSYDLRRRFYPNYYPNYNMNMYSHPYYSGVNYGYSYSPYQPYYTTPAVPAANYWYPRRYSAYGYY
ncbi:hypothetical protein DM01DRAFT_302148 [Hesseltinella vesiculosa]|uniref:Uncharacterized protein n=1 Tax=Hesseltinella vesiculosa TaxID=101127 RepID=A0A1X2G9A1_9FUNG|nr:hypothetical protein DM01DRAFT_302148 [Hesseltinella vesiculosa]